MYVCMYVCVSVCVYMCNVCMYDICVENELKTKQIITKILSVEVLRLTDLAVS